MLALVALVLVGAVVAAWWLSRTPPAAQPPVETANLARTAEGDADIAAAKRLQPTIEADYARTGVKP